MPRQASGPHPSSALPGGGRGPAADLLTGLPGRAALTGLRGGAEAVMHVDLDRFADVNSQHGYQVGDAVLVQFADRLRSLVAPGDVVLRLGADEFALLLHRSPTEESARSLAEQVVDRASAPFVVRLPGAGEVEVRLGASVGLARLPDRDPAGTGAGDDVADLLRDADRAMRRAKSGGRGTVRGPGPRRGGGPDAGASRSPHAVERRLRVALDRGDLQVHFQPVVSLPSGRVVSYEALARWTDDELGTVPPDEFIPVAERGGMITDLGLWVLRRACATATRWPAVPAAGEGPLLPGSVQPGPPTVAVNVSAVQLADPRFADDVVEVLRATGLPGHRLCLEVTETSDLVDLDLAVEQLARVRAEGVRTALDDFGTGRAALSVMRRLPLDVVKIDRDFVAGLARDATDAVMIRGLVDAAHHLGLEVCAEGVEDLEQAQALVSLGVDLAQGWLFGRPVPEVCTAGARAVEVPPPVVDAHVVDEFVVVVDAARLVRFASSGARSVLGETVPLGAGAIRLVHPEHRTGFTDLVARAAPGTTSELTLRTADDAARGSRWLRVRAQAFRRPGSDEQEVVLTVRDVHDRVAAQTAAAVLDHVLSATIDVAPVAIAVSDLAGRLLRTNAAFASMVGRPIDGDDGVVGRTVDDLTHPEDRGQDAANLEKVHAGEHRQVVRKRYLHRDGRVVPAVCEVLVVHAPSGAPVAVVAHVRPQAGVDG
ncbi:EAL domain-containing protein [Aquipuribacter sp. MA13-6]|uniref:EAL domain-containing protein n=1 Tax=unclassified Aquipuribacter TaxID=2635084 RepID=UPI003EED9269